MLVKSHRPAPHTIEPPLYIAAGLWALYRGLTIFEIQGYTVPAVIWMGGGWGFIMLGTVYLFVYLAWVKREMDVRQTQADAELQRARAETIANQSRYENPAQYENMTIRPAVGEWSIEYDGQIITAALVKRFLLALKNGAILPTYSKMQKSKDGFSRDWTKAFYDWMVSVGVATKDSGAGPQSAYTLLDREGVLEIMNGRDIV